MKIKYELKELLNLLICKYIYRPLPMKEINYTNTFDISKDNIKLINNSTFKLFRLKIKNNYYYFREIRKHLLFPDYLKLILDDYFVYSNVDAIVSNNKNLIYEVLLRKKTIKKIYNMGKVYNPYSKISEFFSKKDYNIFNINELKVLGDYNMINLLQYLWGEIFLYKLNIGVKINYYETLNSNKEISTKKIADLFNVGEIIPNTRIIKLTIDKKEIKFGTLMDEVSGISPHCIAEKERLNYTNNFLINTINLNLLDAINYEKDHRPGNYFVTIKNGKVNSLQVFDNDSPQSFGLSSNISLKTYLGAGPLINNGILNYSVIDKKIYNSFLNICKKDLYNELNIYLTQLQLFFLWVRIKKLRKALIKSINNGMIFFDEKEFDINSIKKNKNNFVSYADIFCYKSNINNDFNIKKIINNTEMTKVGK